MPRIERAAVSRRRLRNELRQLRARSGETQREVADSLDWSQAKVMRIEGGRVGISTTDLKALLNHYSVDNATEVARLVELARTSRNRTLSITYSGSLSKEFGEFLENEEAAKVVRHYETRLVPGPLQTEEYARVIIENYIGDEVSERIIEDRVHARLERKDLYLQDDGLEAFFVIDEAAIRRVVGAESQNPNIMVDQLIHLKEVGRKPNISIQVVPFHLGAYRAMETPFVVLEFEDPSDDFLLYLEERDNLILYDNSRATAPFLDIFSELERIATKSENIGTVADHVVRQLQEGTIRIPT